MKVCKYFFICFGIIFLFPYYIHANSSIGLRIGTGKITNGEYNLAFGFGINGEKRIFNKEKSYMNAMIDVEVGMAENKYKNELASDIVRGADYLYRIQQNYLSVFGFTMRGSNLEPHLGIGLSFLNNIRVTKTTKNDFFYGLVLKPDLKIPFYSFYCLPYVRYQFFLGENIKQNIDYGVSIAYKRSRIDYITKIWFEKNQYRATSGNWFTSSLEPQWGIAAGVTMKLQRAGD